MLPFVLKIADRPVERLQRINAENQTIDVDVQLEFYSREFEPTDIARPSRRQGLSQLILQEATESAYANFVTFLRDTRGATRVSAF